MQLQELCDRHNFNSIKVRLKRAGGLWGAAIGAFQFHKGTIKTREHMRSGYKLRNFNSIKVRLKHTKPWGSCEGKCEFQFHKGTIKTIYLSSIS